MLRFFSKRVGRRAQKYRSVEEGGTGQLAHKKHALPCKVMLLDETDLAFDVPVSVTFDLLMGGTGYVVKEGRQC